MKEWKYVLGSIFVILLMLVSTQFVFMKTVTSYPTIHYGDAYVGDFWVSELDVSSEIDEFDYLGIAHARADQDWIAWNEGSGNISANWTVDIDSSNHPEYYIIYTFVVYNIDNESQELGNVSFSQSFDRNETYNESGTLTIPIQFSEGEMQEWEDVTLLCYLGAFVQLNGTEDAKNFVSTADDRSVVAVDFEMPMNEPNFELYIDEANEEFPSMWSWIDGWENHFEDEDEMLNEQTFFNVGSPESLGSQQIDNTSWYLGNWSLRITATITAPFKLLNEGFIPGNVTIEWSNDTQGYVTGWAYVNYSLEHPPNRFWPVRFRAYIFENESTTILHERVGDGKKNHTNPDLDYDYFKFAIWNAHNDMDVVPEGGDGYINVNGFIWARTILPCVPVLLSKYGNYFIHINQSVNQTTKFESSASYYWGESCAYMNETSEYLNVSSMTESGITTVSVDISTIFEEHDQSIYSFAADRGDTRVEFTC